MQRIIPDTALLRAFAQLEAFPSAALAVSGGPDSMALMHLASRWLALKGRPESTIAVLTVDHGLRPESAAEAEFVAAQAKRLGFAHATLRWEGAKPKTGIQAAARAARYSLMSAYCSLHGIACTVTAHTEDDQAETFLMRLRRGSGLDGLAAMAAVSEQAGLPIVRPLLGFSKGRLLAYLRNLTIPYVSDPSNDNPSFERVRVRHAMKALAAAGISRPVLARTASRLGRSREALALAAHEFLERNFRVTDLGQGALPSDAFLALPGEIALRVLARVLALIGGKEDPPRMAKVERLLDELRAGRREASLGGCLVIAPAGMLHFYREPGRLTPAPVPCDPGGTCAWDGRFLITFAAGLTADYYVAPLGEKGWALSRKAIREPKLSSRVDRIAAAATPALWLNGCLSYVPAFGLTAEGMPGIGPEPLAIRLTPRLSHFLK